MRSTLAVLLSAFIADAALAASLSLVVNGGNHPGDAVSVDIVATIEAADNTPPTLGLDLRLSAGGGITWTGSTQTALTAFKGALSWTEFAPICSGADPCVAVMQSNPAPSIGVAADPFNGVIATVTGVLGLGLLGFGLSGRRR